MSDEQAWTRGGTAATDTSADAAETLSRPRAAPTVIVPPPRPPGEPWAVPQRTRPGRRTRVLVWVLVPVLLAAAYTAGAWLATGSLGSALSPPWRHSTPAGATGLASDTYKGGTGTLRVDWATEGLTYTAIITVTGSTGRAAVRFSDSPGYAAAVQESLSLGGRAGDWRYVATDVRDLGPPVYAKRYRLDSFHLAPFGEGRVTVDRVCDVQGNACVPATTVAA